MVQYKYTAYGTITSTTGSLANTIGAYNPFRWKGYYYDYETGMYYCNGRYYVPTWCRWLNGDASSLDLFNINGLNLFSYCENNPVNILCDSDGHNEIVNSSRRNSSSSGDSLGMSVLNKSNLPKVPWLVDNATLIYGVISSFSSGIPIFAHYAKYANIINYEFKIYGISRWKSSLQLSNVNFKMTKLDGFLIGIDVLIDMYDSSQRGVSAEGVMLGAALTAASGVGLLYLNKGIMWATTAIGTAICPGAGTAIGFLVGLGINAFVDWQLGSWISDWIDSITK